MQFRGGRMATQPQWWWLGEPATLTSMGICAVWGRSGWRQPHCAWSSLETGVQAAPFCAILSWSFDSPSLVVGASEPATQAP